MVCVRSFIRRPRAEIAAGRRQRDRDFDPASSVSGFRTHVVSSHLIYHHHHQNKRSQGEKTKTNPACVAAAQAL
jgi:hypothetical protein